jgi:hypothetical protein
MPSQTRRCVFLFLAFNTCALPVLAVGSGRSVAQSAGPSAEQQIYDRYRDWTSGVPVDQRRRRAPRHRTRLRRLRR